jgi:hypothetical protein
MGRKPTRIATASDRISVRVTPDVGKRADALIQAIARETAPQGFTRVTRSVVLKRALEEGLRVLEQRYSATR